MKYSYNEVINEAIESLNYSIGNRETSEDFEGRYVFKCSIEHEDESVTFKLYRLDLSARDFLEPEVVYSFTHINTTREATEENLNNDLIRYFVKAFLYSKSGLRQD